MRASMAVTLVADEHEGPSDITGLDPLEGHWNIFQRQHLELRLDPRRPTTDRKSRTSARVTLATERRLRSHHRSS